MKKLLSPDSKLYEWLSTATEFLLLNLLFLVCCIPVFTIGAAEAGMFKAVRLQADKERDDSVYRAFFRGFTEGFSRITAVWLLLLVLITIPVLTIANLRGSAFGTAPLVMAVIALVFFLLLQPVTSAFHSLFECSFAELLRNSTMLMLMYPLRCALLTLLLYAPAALMLLDREFFVLVAPIFLFIYETFAFRTGSRLLKKPFSMLEERAAKDQGGK